MASPATHAPSGHDEAGLLGCRDELGGLDQAALGVPPADERLEAGQPTVAEVHERLVVEHEVAAADGVLELGPELLAPDDGEVHPRLEELDATLAARLGGVHREVRVTEQVFGRRSRLGDGHAGAAAGEHLLALEVERRAEGGQHPLGDAARGLAVRLLQQDRELVATEAGDRVLRSHDPAQPLGNRRQQLVAGRVAEAVVDGLEVVQVEEHDGQRATRALAGHGMRQAVREQGPVRQPGQGVMECLVLELAFQLFPERDVVDQGGEADRFPLADGPDRELDREFATIAMQRVNLEPRPEYRTLTGLEESSQSLAVGVPLVHGDDPIRELLADNLLARPAERLLRGLVPVGDRAVAVHARCRRSWRCR